MMENQWGLGEVRSGSEEVQSYLFTLHAVVLKRRRTRYTNDADEVHKLSADYVQGLVLYDLYLGVFRVLPYGTDIDVARGARSYREVVQEIESVFKQDDHGEVARVEPLVYVPRVRLWHRIESYEFTRALSELQPTRETRRRSLRYAAKSHIVELLGVREGA